MLNQVQHDTNGRVAKWSYGTAFEKRRDSNITASSNLAPSARSNAVVVDVVGDPLVVGLNSAGGIYKGYEI